MFVNDKNKAIVGGVLNNYQYIKKTFEDLESLFDPFKLPLMTPSQLNSMNNNLIHIKECMNRVKKVLSEVGY